MTTAVDLIKTARARALEVVLRRMAAGYRIGGRYRRVYQHHIRKTAGSSLNAAFWALADLDLKTAIDRGKPCVWKNGYAFVVQDKALIEGGHYFYAHSHLPAWQLQLPPDTFSVTILRDPVARVLSHYRYLQWARSSPAANEMEPAWRGLRREFDWLGESFGDFLERLPPAHLLNQLHMFSRDGSVEEAAQRISSCSAVCFTESFAADLQRVAAYLDLPLQVRHERRFGSEIELAPDELAHARSKLEPEYALLDLLARNGHEPQRRDNL